MLSQWSDIEDEFDGALLLGNGASIAVDLRFSYPSLLSTAREQGLVTNRVQRVFDYFVTNDFEHVLELLWRTYRVNTALGTGAHVTRRAYEEVRAALVGAVLENHTEYPIVDPHIERIYTFLQRFDKVISLNYDLIVYWAMMKGNERLGNWFKDCFIHSGRFEYNWKDLEEPYEADGTTLVFYPHGNLILATTRDWEEIKIQREDEFEILLDRIAVEWNGGEVIPLFVSEGETRQKLKTIRRSEYLSRVYHSVLPDAGPSLVIYGSSLNDNDDHIFQQLRKSRIDRIAISVYRGDRVDDEIASRVEDVRGKLSGYWPRASLTFFDAESDGCWLY
jgi:hypothetical protein